MNRTSRTLAALLAAVVLCADPVAAQDTRAAAVQLFDAAQALAQQRRFAEACPKFGESYRLDPQLGALLHYADCLEQNSQLASAYAAFRDAIELATQKSDERKTVAEQRARSLEPRLSRLTIDVAPAARVSGLEVLRDGTPITEAMFGMPIAVDGGRHSVEARAPGRRPIKINVALKSEGDNHRVVVPGLEADGASTPAPAPAPATPAPAAAPAPVPAPETPADSATPPADDRGDRQGVPVVTWVAGGVAVVGLGVGIAFNLMARSAAEDAENACDSDFDDVCVVSDESARSDREADLDSARSNATISYVGFGFAGAGAAIAVITLLTSKSSAATSTSSSALALTPHVGTRAGGLSLRGSF